MALRLIFSRFALPLSLVACSTTALLTPPSDESSLPEGPLWCAAPSARPAAAEDGDDPRDSRTAPATPTLTPRPSLRTATCPPEMVSVEGMYCPKVRQVCARWIDPPGPYREFRCAEYVQPATCVVAREQKHFCIDREEHVRPGESLPVVQQSWTSAGEICSASGKRLCLESEWQFACEGEEMHPYPYGSGFERDASLCNIDRTDLGRPQNGLRDLRAPSSAYPRCVSPFGVHHMSGNVEEWATLDAAPADARDHSSMKGSWWLPGKNTCRAATVGHGEIYRGPQVGVRCCRDATP